MIRISSEDELIAKFRPLDQGEVYLSPQFEFPLAVKDYLAWTEPSGHRSYLVFEDPTGAILGIAFRIAHGTGEPTAKMCEWCHSVRGGNAVALLSVTVSRHRRIGLHLCRDLSCKEKVQAAPGVNDMRESLHPDEKVRRILGRISNFARTNLF